MPDNEKIYTNNMPGDLPAMYQIAKRKPASWQQINKYQGKTSKGYLLQQNCNHSLGPVHEFVCISFRTGNLNCFRVKLP